MKALIRWLLASVPLVSLAQSQLPPCPATGYRHNCYGTLTYANGAKYVGEFKDGKFHGQGTVTLPNGHKYAGEYKDDKRNGQGIEYRANGLSRRNPQGGLWTCGGRLGLLEKRRQLMQD